MAARKVPGGGKGQEKMWRESVHRAVKRRSDGDDKKALERLAQKLVERGLEGNIAALREIGDRLDGKPTQAVNLAQAGDRAEAIQPRRPDHHQALWKPADGYKSK